MANEFITIYIDLHYNYLKNRHIASSLEKFCKEKLKVNPESIFSLFYYKKGATPTFEEDIKDPSEVKKIIKQDWKKRDESESYFENGMFYCLSYLGKQAQKHSGTFRVVVISDLPSQKNDEYTKALMNLVETVRNFPTFIDIIRVGQQRFYKDDVKLRIISTISNGGLFYVTGRGTLDSTLLALVHNKKMPDLIPGQTQIIEEDKRKYYENMAQDLIYIDTDEEGGSKCLLCKRNICNYCDSHEDRPLSCPECGFEYHECCAAHYTFGANIGLLHVFRCVGCGNLLKMDESLVKLINGLDEKEEKQIDTTGKEVWTPPKDDKETKKREMEQKSKKDQDIEEKRTTQILKFREEKKKEIKSAPKTALQRRKRKRTAMFCRICAQVLKPTDKVCSKCGSLQ